MGYYGDGSNITGIVDTGSRDDIALLGFKVAANGSLAKYNLVDQAIDAFEDASGVDAGSSTDEVRNAAGNYYSGTSPASGGTETSYDDGGTDYAVHTFLSSGTFVAGATADADILVVAGGGYGSTGDPGGGGGAGGMLVGNIEVSAGSKTITVGAGGTSGVGDDSIFDVGGLDATADGGGNGGAGGGSGGGGNKTGGGGSASQGDSGGLTGYGNNGGTGGSANRSAGGGGGAGGAGGAGDNGAGSSGNGATGVSNVYRTGSAVYYAGGGGGGHDNQSGGAGSGGNGGGGAGGKGTSGTAGTANTGGGGGGSYGTGTNGGSGIVVIRFVEGAFDGFNDMTLISNATTAESVPTVGDLVITYTNGVGTATINTDIKAYITRDGSDYTNAVTLVDQGDTGGHTILTANNVDLTGETSGTAMRWKIETLNQGETKETRVHAVSLGWR